MDEDRTQDVSGLLKQGLSHYCAGDTRSAIVCWEEARELDPENRAVMDYLETAYEEVGTSATRAPTATVGPSTTKLGTATEFSKLVERNDVTASRTPPTTAPPSRLQRSEPPVVGDLDPSATPSNLGSSVERGVPRPEREAAAPTLAELPEDDPDTTIGAALEAYRAGRLDEAYTVLAKVAEDDPERLDVQGYIQLIRKAQAEVWISEIGDQGRTVTLQVSTPELMKYQFAPDEGFMISQVDGSVTISDLISLSCADRVRTLEIIARFLRERIIS